MLYVALTLAPNGTMRVRSTMLQPLGALHIVSMLYAIKVLSEHIVDTILSTSLTLLRATFSAKGECGALEGAVSDGGEGKLHT